MIRTTLSKSIKAVALVIFSAILATSAQGGVDNGVGNDGQNNGHHGEGNNGNGNGNGGSVPVNGGLLFLAVAGVAYSAKKFYELKHKPAVTN